MGIWNDLLKGLKAVERFRRGRHQTGRRDRETKNCKSVGRGARNELTVERLRRKTSRERELKKNVWGGY